MRKFALIAGLAAVVLAVGCSFSEYAQVTKLEDNVDDYRTGCEIDEDTLVEQYVQWEANQHYYPGFGLTPEPTPTPSPLRDSEVATKVFLAKVWENGCQAGRRDAAGAEQATLMGLRDQLDLLDVRIAALEPTPTPTPTP